MKIARVFHQGRILPALVDAEAGKAALLGRGFAQDVNPVLTIIERGYDEAELRKRVTATVPWAEVRALSPLSRLVRNVLAVGKNYREHAAEFDKSGFNATAGESSSFPQIFTKATTSLCGPTDDIVFDPRVSQSVDYEGEIAAIVRDECRGVSKADALDHVWGYMALNDVTARDVQRNHAQWFLGKSFDTFCPIGPWVVTADEVQPATTRLQTWVNGELRQNVLMADLIFDVPTLVETMSRSMTLLPGDVIATGTPVGVGIGFKPPRFLANGDVVRIAVTNMGELSNRVRAE